ncbi:hypothetical protein [Microbispora triticiradicis]|uniref:Uncharacterized protein n=2 Tax=Microbispora TaxID=2005 RepID=A0ABY3M4M8_9ACTN|nr:MULTISPECIES: hypothetical protein [Microbispora]TLP57024.1 hypothetical protein FED44_21675 [Microbispora fusca]TYB66980.1 hypothetical protein FXF59_04115 [Microbispora tritici]
MTGYVRTIRRAIRENPDPTWMDLPLAGERLSEIVLFGHGKDADVMVELLDGRRFVLGLGGMLRVRGCPAMRSEVIRWDDRSLIIRYRGDNLKIAAFRIEIPSWNDDLETFQAMVRKWLAKGGTEDLTWCLSMDIEVTA